MAVLSRRSFNTIEILRVDSDPNGTSAIAGSLAKVVGSSVVWKNVGGTSWEVLNSGALAPLSGPAGSPVGASYVVLGGDGTLTSERVLTAGSGITLTDGGAGGSLTIAASGGGGGSGDFIRVESKVLTEAAQTLTFSSLDGNSDKIYRVFLKRGTLSQNQAAASIRPNGSTSNLSSRVHYWYPGTHSIGSESAWGIGFTSATYLANSQLSAEITIMATAGSYRFMNASVNYINSTDHVGMHVSGLWQNSADNITSLDFYMPTAWPVGTEIHLFKLATS